MFAGFVSRKGATSMEMGKENRDETFFLLPVCTEGERGDGNRVFRRVSSESVSGEEEERDECMLLKRWCTLEGCSEDGGAEIGRVFDTRTEEAGDLFRRGGCHSVLPPCQRGHVDPTSERHKEIVWLG